MNGSALLNGLRRLLRLAVTTLPGRTLGPTPDLFATRLYAQRPVKRRVRRHFFHMVAFV
jgi:hypothetical protein